MPLHPFIRSALAKRVEGPPLHTLAIDEARRVMKGRYPPAEPRIEIGRTRDLWIAGKGRSINLRLYWPEGGGPFPILLFCHGSGFVALDLDTHDDICRRLCRGSGAIVASVDYALAPEQPFPAGLEDCVSAYHWVVANAPSIDGRADAIILSGDSAGACLAALTATAMRDEPVPARGQLLLYPVMDHYSSATGSYQRFGNGEYGLTADSMKWYWDLYLPGDLATEEIARAAPLRTPDLTRAPPAFILTAECDILRDEGESYAKRLLDASVEVRLVRAEGMNHGFLKWIRDLPEAAHAMDAACGWVVERCARTAGA